MAKRKGKTRRKSSTGKTVTSKSGRKYRKMSSGRWVRVSGYTRAKPKRKGRKTRRRR